MSEEEVNKRLQLIDLKTAFTESTTKYRARRQKSGVAAFLRPVTRWSSRSIKAIMQQNSYRKEHQSRDTCSCSRLQGLYQSSKLCTVNLRA
jgi:hypothetical protein